MRKPSVWHAPAHAVAILFALTLASPVRATPTKAELSTLLVSIDEQQRNTGDYRADTYMEQHEKGKLTIIYEAQIFRRAADERFALLFTAPKGSQGQGYLRIDKNLWFYDPSVGKWERRTERERIGGTNSRRADLDSSRLSDDYDPSYLADEKLGAYDVVVLKLTAKSDRDVAFPVLKLWVNKDGRNVLKREEYALSGRLLRTCYYPKWKKIFSESKKADLWVPEEVRIFDEVEKENSTTVVIRSVDLRPLDDSIFSKAWLESKSR